MAESTAPMKENIAPAPDSVNAERFDRQPFWGRRIVAQRFEVVMKRTRPGDRVLDIGTGQGAYVAALTHNAIRAFGTDRLFCHQWVQAPKKRFCQSDAHALPFRSKAFDVAVAFEVLEHTASPGAVLEEIRRCTVRRLLLSVPNCEIDQTLREHDLVLAHWADRSHRHFFTKRSIAALLQQHRYTVVDIDDCYPVRPSHYFWNTLRIPRVLRNALKRSCDRLRLSKTHWSSILIDARIL